MNCLRLTFLTIALAHWTFAVHASAQTSATVQVGATMQGAARKVLFLGNSITKHGPKEDIDWSGDWGMAASSESNDYVHLMTKALTERSGRPHEVMVVNIADYERAYAGYDLKGKLRDALQFDADLVVVAIGENVPELKSAEDKAKFTESATRLLRTLKKGPQTMLLVRSCFWADGAKDEALQLATREVNGIFVDISALSKDEGHYARSERSFKNEGVAKHPGDKGMAAIAKALLEAVPR